MKIQRWQKIPELDAEIRTIENPTKDFNEWIVEVGLFESLGEMGGDILTLFFKKQPTTEQIKTDARNHLIEQYNELSKPFKGYIPNALSGREEMQLRVLKKILKR